jgi:hypothetical protein
MSPSATSAPGTRLHFERPTDTWLVSSSCQLSVGSTKNSTGKELHTTSSPFLVRRKRLGLARLRGAAENAWA